MTNEAIEKAKEWCKHFNCYENNGFRKGNCPLDGYEECKEIIQLYDRLQTEKEQIRKETAKEVLQKAINICDNEIAMQEREKPSSFPVPMWNGIANGCGRVKWELKVLAEDMGVEVFADTKTEYGTLVRLPCKIGDEVFYVCNDNIETYTIDKIVCDQEGWYFTVDDEDHYEHYFDDESIIGVTVFFERDKAEAKLKELKGENE